MFCSKIQELQNKYVRAEFSIAAYHFKVANLYRTWQSKFGPTEEDVLEDNIEDEVFAPAGDQPAPAQPEDDLGEGTSQQRRGQRAPAQPVDEREDLGEGTSQQRAVQAVVADTRFPEDDEAFAPLSDWSDLELSDDELLAEEEIEDDMQEQASRAERILNQKVVQCRVCLSQCKNKHVTLCGHYACLECFHRVGVFESNNQPYPRCPICRSPVQAIVKIYDETMAPLHELLDEAEIQQIRADAELNRHPSGPKIYIANFYS